MVFFTQADGILWGVEEEEGRCELPNVVSHSQAKKAGGDLYAVTTGAINNRPKQTKFIGIASY